MKTIWKFPFKIEDCFLLSMPKGAQILSFQMQNNVPTIWALVDELAEKEDRVFRVFGTGQPYNPQEALAIYIGTVQERVEGVPPESKSIDLVWHLFELVEKFNLIRQSKEVEK